MSPSRALSIFRIIGAVLAVVATVLVVSPNFETPHTLALVILPFAGGLLAGWQPAGNSNIGRLSGSMLVSITWNFLIGFVALTIAFLGRVAAGNASFALPDIWWMYLGGPLGLASIALMALLVRRLGLLLLALASTAGQLVGLDSHRFDHPRHGDRAVVTSSERWSPCPPPASRSPSNRVREEETTARSALHDGIAPESQPDEVRS